MAHLSLSASPQRLAEVHSEKCLSAPASVENLIFMSIPFLLAGETDRDSIGNLIKINNQLILDVKRRQLDSKSIARAPKKGEKSLRSRL